MKHLPEVITGWSINVQVFSNLISVLSLIVALRPYIVSSSDVESSSLSILLLLVLPYSRPTPVYVFDSSVLVRKESQHSEGTW